MTCACGCGAVLRVARFASDQPKYVHGHHRRGRKCSKPYANKRDVSERFWDKVDKVSSERGCWLWTAADDGHGYGEVSVDGKPEKAHRVAWTLTNGPIPYGLHVLHKCDNPPCVNPDHLFLGTQKDNSQDASQKGRLRIPSLRGDSHPNAKLTNEEAKAIYARARAGEPSRAIARDYSISRDTVRSIANGKGWTHATKEVA